eukprot:SAG31_NODE_4183_length_3495_cov_1.668728_3_plen_145_part_00
MSSCPTSTREWTHAPIMSLGSAVWSAPNYCYRCGNEASILEVREDGQFSESRTKPSCVTPRHSTHRHHRLAHANHTANFLDLRAVPFCKQRCMNRLQVVHGSSPDSSKHAYARGPARSRLLCLGTNGCYRSLCTASGADSRAVR